MKEVNSVERYQTEKAIIDALLKISEIIKKTTHTNPHSKKTKGDGDKKQQRNEYDYDVPIPPPLRKLESYVSGFNKEYTMSSSNCNRSPFVLWNSRPYGNLDQRYYSATKKRRISHDYQDSSHNCHHHYDDSSSENHHRKKSSRHYAKHESSVSNKKRRIKCECQTVYDNNKYSASDC